MQSAGQIRATMSEAVASLPQLDQATTQLKKLTSECEFNNRKACFYHLETADLVRIRFILQTHIQ